MWLDMLLEAQQSSPVVIFSTDAGDQYQGGLLCKSLNLDLILIWQCICGSRQWSRPFLKYLKHICVVFECSKLPHYIWTKAIRLNCLRPSTTSTVEKRFESAPTPHHPYNLLAFWNVQFDWIHFRFSIATWHLIHTWTFTALPYLHQIWHVFLLASLWDETGQYLTIADNLQWPHWQIICKCYSHQVNTMHLGTCPQDHGIQNWDALFHKMLQNRALILPTIEDNILQLKKDTGLHANHILICNLIVTPKGISTMA